mmetsp:Transcript_103490/g.178317  ORF Transcript_103490/g.178317 Transcript_103490/m.178317 type:complete len:230 (+) Transcript_103490:20024-20713(+)
MAFSGAKTAIITPPRGCCCIRRARSATMSRASSSESTPERQAATSSPKLCPITTFGTMPCSLSVMAREYSTANSAGWAYCVWLISSALSFDLSTSARYSVGIITCSSGFGRQGSRICAHCCKCLANIGSWSYRVLHMPAYCEPCPVKMSATFFWATKSTDLFCCVSKVVVCFSTRWEFVPPKPKELTLAKRFLPRPGRGVVSVGMMTGKSSTSSSGFKMLRCKLGVARA